MQERRLDPEQAQEVIREAVRLQQEQENRLELETLEASAAELGIDPQHLREALRRVEQERARRAQRQRVMLIVLAVVVGAFVLNLLVSHWLLSRAWAEVALRRAQLQNVQQRQQSLIPRLEQLARQVDEQQRAHLQTLANALRENPQAVGTLAQELLRDPALRNDWLIVRLMDEITGSENRIAVERKRYNEAVARYEQLARQFPINLARPFLGYPKSVEPLGAGF
ncbi:MAG: LemA family protein [Fimbriimonadales bacterium]|nr:LemA family protein [Fimbriimonadales bacterium]MDW8051457.1 LemA family protein [Armatimonadota bacterium]